MATAKIADLKNNLSRYLGKVRNGAEFTVLDRTTPVARLVPYDADRRGGGHATGDDAEAQSAARIAELTRQGVLSAGDPRAVVDWLEAHRRVKRPAGSRSATRLLIAMRRESSR